MGHIISKIHIKNFKSIIEQEFELSKFSPLVGYNNAGKSNILEAIKWVLRKSPLPASFCASLDSSDLETLLPDDHEEIQNCINWILS